MGSHRGQDALDIIGLRTRRWNTTPLSAARFTADVGRKEINNESILCADINRLVIVPAG